ncbi:TOBE domain-containing protein [Timonella senegalensis]
MRAHVTPAAIAELNLLPGDRVVASIKASQVALYPVHQKS